MIEPAKRDENSPAMERARTLHREGRLDEAEALYRQALDAAPGSREAILGLGLIAHQRGRYDRVAELMEGAIAAGGSDPAFHVNLGNALQLLGRPKEAVEAYRRAVAIEPDAGAYGFLGNALYGLGRLDDAVDAYRRAADLAPEVAETHYNMGNALYASGRPGEAVAAYARGIAIGPERAEAFYNLANALQAADRPKEAVNAYRKALELRPAYAAAANNLGAVLLNLGRPGDAEAAFRRALDMEPDYARACYNLGNALMARQRSEEAAAAFRRASEIDPDYLEAHTNLGNVLHELGRLEDSAAAFRRVLAIESGNAYARHMIATITGEATHGAPEGYVRAVFDNYAPRFEEHLVRELAYTTPRLMRRAVDRARAPEERAFGRVLDLGCGTGLVGKEFRDIADHLVGLDLSPKMVQEAERKGLYDALHVADAVMFLDNGAVGSPAFDLIVAADVFCYTGDLGPAFAAAKRRLATGGLFVFSVENADGATYRLLPSGRYAHGDGYVVGLAETHGYRILSRDRAVLRRSRAGPVEGTIFVLTGEAPVRKS